MSAPVQDSRTPAMTRPRTRSVVSPSSEDRGRSEKASGYMRLTSLKHLCFIDRDRVHIDIFDRSEAGWLPRPPIERVEETFALDTIEFTMQLAEVYGDVRSHQE